MAADLSLWAGDQNRCVAVIAKIHDLLDDLEQGLAPEWRGQVVAADTAAWVGDKDRCVTLISDALPKTELSTEIVPGQRFLFADDFCIQNLVTDILRDEGFEVTSVDTGDRVEIVLETEQFDLLLADMRMPGTKDGIGLAEYAWQHDPSLPVVCFRLCRQA